MPDKLKNILSFKNWTDNFGRINNMESLEICWYGRCCFLIKYQGKSVLFDPYDAYCGVEIGRIKADVVIISSTWHDHGHVGASPLAHIYSYSGQHQHDGLTITGIEAKEDRGSPTVIFNLKIGPYSLTNFADFGPEQKEAFDKSVTQPEKKVLEGTNIAFIRASIKTETKGKHVHNEIALNYCQPKIIIPEHYFPKSFTLENVPEKLKKNFLPPVKITEEMIKKFQYPVKEINGHKASISPSDLKSNKLIKFLKLPPQVKFVE